MKNVIEHQSLEVLDELRFSIRELLPGYGKYDLLAAAFLLREASTIKGKADALTDIYEQIGKSFAEEIMNYTKVDVVWDRIKSLAKRYGTDVFDYILTQKIVDNEGRYFEMADLPNSIVYLCNRILKIRDEGKVAQFFPGTGLSLMQWANERKKICFLGIDTDKKNIFACRMRILHMPNIRILLSESKTDLINDVQGEKFDWILSTPPFGMKTRMLCSRYEELSQKRYYVKSGMAAEWLYAGDLMDTLKEGGKGISIMTTGCMFTKQDEEARKYFVENGYIEAVIQLPAKLYTFTSIPVVMVVFSRGNKGIRMINASDLCKKGRRVNELTYSDIDKICTMLHRDSDEVITLTSADLAKKDYDLLPERYLEVQTEEIKNGVFLDQLVTFHRAAILKAQELDAMTEEYEDTNVRYLRIGDIQNGCIDATQLKSISDLKIERDSIYLKKGDIVLSKNGDPFKLALYPGSEKLKVLPVGNMYILCVDEDKIRPAYLKVYLESRQGLAQLKRTLTGMIVPVIRMELLKKVVIPVPSLNEQKKIEEEYFAIMDEIDMLNQKKVKAMNRLANLLDEKKETISFQDKVKSLEKLIEKL